MKFIPIEREPYSIEVGDFVYFDSDIHILVDVYGEYFIERSDIRYVLVNLRTGGVYDDHYGSLNDVCESLEDQYTDFRIIRTKNIEVHEVKPTI